MWILWPQLQKKMYTPTFSLRRLQYSKKAKKTLVLFFLEDMPLLAKKVFKIVHNSSKLKAFFICKRRKKLLEHSNMKTLLHNIGIFIRQKIWHSHVTYTTQAEVEFFVKSNPTKIACNELSTDSFWRFRLFSESTGFSRMKFMSCFE